MGKLATFCRLAVNPGAYPFIWRQARSRLTHCETSLEASAPESARWCAARAAGRERAAETLVGERKFASIRELFPKVLAEADRAQRECPIKMGGAGDVDLLYSLAAHLRAKRIIETGVAYGWSSLALLLALSQQTEGQLISTNLHYREFSGEEHVGCVVPETLRSQWTILRQADQSALPEAIKRLAPVDLCHYDSDKSYAGRIWAYSAMWSALRVGGCLISDDIGDNLAFVHFSRMASGKPVIVGCAAGGNTKYVGVLMKANDRPLREMLF